MEEYKYSHRGSISWDDIPIEDLEIALVVFGEGSIGMQKCLRAMLQRNLKTHSCYANIVDDYDIAYIIMEEHKNLFGYLSEVLLKDDLVQIYYEGDRQVIRFAGNKAKIESSLLALARDIQSGKKNNSELLKSKIYKPFPIDWYKEYQSSENNEIVKELLMIS